jgi:N-methylhydantoinase A/oxoprolinase/acetone carboxylase beta subunit
MSDLRAIAERIKILRDQRRRLTTERAQLVAKQRGDTRKLLAEFAEAHQRLSKQSAQARAAELNAIRARANAVQAEAKGLLKTFERERQVMAQTLLSEAKALHQKLASDNQVRLAEHKSLMTRIAGKHKAICDTVRSIATDVQRRLKVYEQTRCDSRNAWHQILCSGTAQATRLTEPAVDSPFAINIPFTPPKQTKQK